MDSGNNKIDNEYFDSYISQLVAGTHYVLRDVFIADALSVQSEEYKMIQSKPERYSMLLENKLDFVLAYRRNVFPERVVLLRTIEEFTENGWFYEEMSLMFESLGIELDKVSLTKPGIKDYFDRIKSKEILSQKGESLTSAIAFPKVYFDGKRVTQKKVEKAFRKWRICPQCAAKLHAKSSNQKGYEDKIIYMCPATACGFKVSLSKTDESEPVSETPIRDKVIKKFNDFKEAITTWGD